jgi:hypothetical protein
MSAVIPAPEEGSNPAIVSTTGEASAIAAIYRKDRWIVRTLFFVGVPCVIFDFFFIKMLLTP